MDLTITALVVLIAAALLIGIAKTALPGAATLSVAAFAAILPARESTAALLVLLLVGDVVAIWSYRRDVDWRILARLLPTVVGGMIVGWLFLASADDPLVRRGIGAILLTLTALTLTLRRRGHLTAERALTNPWIRGVFGSLGGFTSMAANAGGPVMTLYFVAARFDVLRFLGTQAWFFFVLNAVKLPFSIGLGLLQPSMLPLLGALAPVVLAGAFAGRVWARRIDKTLFDRVVIGLTIASSLYLLV